MAETAWGAFLFLLILATPIAFFFFAFWLYGRAVHKWRMKEAPLRDKANAKAAILQGMYDQQVHREALTEVVAEGAVEIESELRVRRIIEQMRSQGELSG